MGWDEYIWASSPASLPLTSLPEHLLSSRHQSEDLNQKKRSTAFQLPEQPASLATTLTTTLDRSPHHIPLKAIIVLPHHLTFN